METLLIIAAQAAGDPGGNAVRNPSTGEGRVGICEHDLSRIAHYFNGADFNNCRIRSREDSHARLGLIRSSRRRHRFTITIYPIPFTGFLVGNIFDVPVQDVQRRTCTFMYGHSQAIHTRTTP